MIDGRYLLVAVLTMAMLYLCLAAGLAAFDRPSDDRRITSFWMALTCDSFILFLLAGVIWLTVRA